MNKVTLVEALREGWHFLRDSGKESPRLEAEVLLAYLLKKDRTALYRDLDEEVSSEVLEDYKKSLQERAKGKPLAYITNHREFMSLDFYVDERVLIPRPETEILVEEILKHRGSNPLVLDVGTGSGAIAITIAKNLIGGKVLAVDISPEALEVAKGNALTHQVEKVVEFCQSDLLEEVPKKYLGKINWIAANLPYIPLGDRETLQTEVKDYEPHLALFGGEDGLDIYRRLIPQAWDFLATEGKLVCEITPGQGEALLALFPKGLWHSGRIIKDFASLERFIEIKKGNLK